MFFSGPVFILFSELPFGGFLACLVSKKTAFRLGCLSKTLLAPKSLARAKKARNDTKSCSKLGMKPTQNRGSKMVPAKVVGNG